MDALPDFENDRARLHALWVEFEAQARRGAHEPLLAYHRPGGPRANRARGPLLKDAPLAPPAQSDERNLFPAFLEVRGVSPHDFPEEVWAQFLEDLGMDTIEDQVDYIADLDEWGGTLDVARAAAAGDPP